jgi:DNA-directed RNA polymerase specialized sigma24 family protein
MIITISHTTLQSLSRGDQLAFKKFYDESAPAIHSASSDLFKSQALAYDFVGEIFSDIWVDRAKFTCTDDLAAYVERRIKDLLPSYFRKAVQLRIGHPTFFIHEPIKESKKGRIDPGISAE